MAVNIIVAVGRYVRDKGYPIGKDGKIPWHNSNDLKWFKETTMGHPVIMGRKTWDNLPKALPGRINIVVGSSTIDVSPRDEDIVYKVSSVEAAIDKAKELSTEDIFIIGGASIYKYALDHRLVDNAYVDYLSEECEDADAFFLLSQDEYWEDEKAVKVEEEKAYAHIYSRCHGKNNHVDEQYLRLVNDIITNGEEKDTRAGKTRSVFGRQLRLNLKEGLPILTTKKVFTKGVIHELLWFLSGNTNIKYLVDNNVHIWDDDAYRYYLELVAKENEWRKGKFATDKDGNPHELKPDVAVDKEQFLKYVKLEATHEFIHKTSCYLGYEYHYGDLSRVYGAQWTNWGGHNQVQEVIDKLKTNPDDRRMIISAWNVGEIPDMALPPCHYCCQFYTKKMTLLERRQWRSEHLGMHFCTEDSDEQQVTTMDKEGVPTRKLSCMWNQRSVDTGIGFSFNLLSYSVLTHLIAQCVNMDVDEVIFNGGDCHVYENHIEPLKEQVERNPYKYALPKLVLNSKINNIFDFKYEDIKIEGYESYPAIKMPLSVGL